MKLRPLALGDLVLRKIVGAAKNPSWGKLGLNWKGPYRITSVAGIGAYYLEDLDEKVVPRPWNVNNRSISLAQILSLSSMYVLHFGNHLSTRQNQGLAWFSDSNLWEN